ncbi:MAG: hypothetical protein ACI85N_001684 [Gammaproteobacteria bacterium]|jgi:hypothetical protein
MLDKLFKKPLELKIGDQTLQFSSVTDVAFCLEGRTSLSSAKLAELFALSGEELETQAEKLAGLNKTMFKILNSVVDEPENIDRSMRELDTQMFSQDQNWRDIIQSLNKEQGDIDTIRVTVIMKYMKYLSAVEDTIGYIRAGMKQNEGAVANGDVNKPSEFETTWNLGHLPEELKSSTQAENRAENPAETEFKRLPKDTAVSVKLSPGEKMAVRLASYPGQLVATNDSVQYVDESGTTVLNKGPNMVGRSVKGTVKIDAAQKHVSRTHLSILITDGNALQLTDHSSEGTFISSAFIK